MSVLSGGLQLNTDWLEKIDCLFQVDGDAVSGPAVAFPIRPTPEPLNIVAAQVSPIADEPQTSDVSATALDPAEAESSPDTPPGVLRMLSESLGSNQSDFDNAIDRLADLIADRLAARFDSAHPADHSSMVHYRSDLIAPIEGGDLVRPEELPQPLVAEDGGADHFGVSSADLGYYRNRELIEPTSDMSQGIYSRGGFTSEANAADSFPAPTGTAGDFVYVPANDPSADMTVQSVHAEFDLVQALFVEPDFDRNSLLDEYASGDLAFIFESSANIGDDALLG
ncbi:MAG: hypothetical protein ACFE0P_03135 [Oceanicaulis sp.]